MSGVVGREVEQAAIEEFLADAGAGSGALCLEGEPGIGKTALWRWAVARAEAAGTRVLRAQPAEAEQQLAFAMLADLLADAHDEIGVLAPPQRCALRIALLLEEADGRPLGERVVGTAVASVLRGLARESAVLVAIDDFQWADASSLACVRFALRRLAGGTGAVLTCRTGFDVGIEVERLPVGLLDDAAVRELVVRAARGTLAGDDVARIAALAAGHPLYALELVRENVRRNGPPPRRLSVPAAIADVVRRRVDSFPPAARRELVRLAAGGAGVDLSGTCITLGVEAGLLEQSADDVRFAHPLFASAVYAAATPRTRRAIHAELAEAADGIERARHLAAAAAGPDEQVAAALDDAVLRARGRGATGVAAELALAAVEASPPESPLRAARLVEAATRQQGAGNLRAAHDLLEQALVDAPPDVTRARALLRLGAVLKDSGRPDEALARLHEALTATDLDDALRAALHASIAYVLQFTIGPAAAEPDARRAVELAERSNDDVLLAQCLGTLARIEFWLGRGVQRAAIERAVELERRGAELHVGPRPSLLLASQVAAVGEVDEARELLTETLRALRDVGEPVHAVLHRLSLLEHGAGDWGAAERHAREALDEARYAGERSWERFGLHALATVEAFRGDVDAATRSIDRLLEIAAEIGESTYVVGSRELLGFLALSQGDPLEAERQLSPAHARLHEMGVEEPRRFPFLPDEIEALIQLGRLDDAERWIDWLEARGAAAARGWARGSAARCRALLLEAVGEDAEDSFASALRELEREGPFERARTLLAHGAWLRRRRHNAAARTALLDAETTFVELGAQLWLARTREEQSQIGGRPPAPRRLTPTERRIADRVASGLSNAEVARELYLSPKTVEWNLSKIYRKLGVRSRTELAAQFAKHSS
jgi:DNA-binding CsgD family transcriptional regulator